ncbi:MAG: hypothetical protein JNM07_01540 [Phycisphaerae bacterium]|nr:hypothetical protein [Phycisphaerae bacterium]
MGTQPSPSTNRDEAGSGVSSGIATIAARRRDEHLGWLKTVTQIPTAAGHEWRVIDWVKRWAAERPELVVTADGAGNLVVAPEEPWRSPNPPVYFTAHMDHPAFVVERIVGPGTVELSFRGGVMDVFFDDAPVLIHPREGPPLAAHLTAHSPSGHRIFKCYLAELDDTSGRASTREIRPDDVGTWLLLPSEIDAKGLLHAPACDDLAALAAALGAFDTLRLLKAGGHATEDVRLLFTRAEEVGFVGAIAACKRGTLPRLARVVALENSRAFPDSPIGGGPIVRVGDRLSTFTPWLTSACAKRAEDVFAGPAQPTAQQTKAAAAKRPWQRKLMAGGACEASVFCASGYDATCLCLPLGNYHNMAHLSEIQGHAYDREAYGPPRAAREFISVTDFVGLVDLLVSIGLHLPPVDPVLEQMDKLYAERSFVLGER